MTLIDVQLVDSEDFDGSRHCRDGDACVVDDPSGRGTVSVHEYGKWSGTFFCLAPFAVGAFPFGAGAPPKKGVGSLLTAIIDAATMSGLQKFERFGLNSNDPESYQ
jgi:hypothetical protein